MSGPQTKKWPTFAQLPFWTAMLETFQKTGISNPLFFRVLMWRPYAYLKRPPSWFHMASVTWGRVWNRKWGTVNHLRWILTYWVGFFYNYSFPFRNLTQPQKCLLHQFTVFHRNEKTPHQCGAKMLRVPDLKSICEKWRILVEAIKTSEWWVSCK